MALGAQTTQQVYWADPLVDEHGEDRTMGLSFFHDHMSAASWQQHGLYGAMVVEPAGSTWRDPETGEIFGTRDDGGPTSYRADILTVRPEDSFREFNLAIADFALLYDGAGNPINPPTAKELDLPFVIGHRMHPAPEAISQADPGTMLLNYRHEPIPLRVGQPTSGAFEQKPGPEGDMANVFSSEYHGDPVTPIFRGYRGDRVVMRLFQGSHEEQHVFGINGHRWLRESGDEDSGYVSAQAVGISENFAFGLGVLGDTTGAFADYLYAGLTTDDLWNGMWGIMRAYNTPQSDLLTLPNNPRPQAGPRSNAACPPGASLRRYSVHAITARGNLPEDRLVYNARHGLYDPDAILFVDANHLEDLRAGLRDPEPLILRAAAGECIQVSLTNELPEELPPSMHFNFNPPIVDYFNTNQVRTSNHVSLNAQLVAYDPRLGDGANVGHNPVQTVAPGETRVTRWYAGRWERGPRGSLEATPIEFGAVNLRSMADVVNHGVHGAVGALIIEPLGATWVSDPGTEVQATVSYVDSRGHSRTFREFVMVIHDELATKSDDSLFAGGDPVEPRALRNLSEYDDAQESGHKGFNYRMEPLWARLDVPPEVEEDELSALQQADILSSAHGDPETAVFHAEVGDALRIRVLIPSGHPRQHAVTMHGALWPSSTHETGSASAVMGVNKTTSFVGNQGGLAAGMSVTLMPNHGAGGPFGVAGDYLLRNENHLFLYGGIWTIIRVRPAGEEMP